MVRIENSESANAASIMIGIPETKEIDECDGISKKRKEMMAQKQNTVSTALEHPTTEFSCCQQSSPKIIPRPTRIRLNLDIPEPDFDRHDSDPMDSTTEKTNSLCGVSEKNFLGNSIEDDLEKTISVDRALHSGPGKLNKSSGRTWFSSDGHSNYISSDSELISTPYDLTKEITKDFSVYDESSSIIQAASGLESSPLPNCFSTFTQAASSPKECRDSAIQRRTRAADIHYKLNTETLVFDGLYCYRATDDNITGDPKREISKFPSQPDVLNSLKRNLNPEKCENNENIHVAGNNEPKEYYLTRKVFLPSRKCNILKSESIKEPQLLLSPAKIHKPRVSTKVRNDENSKNEVDSQLGAWSASFVSVDFGAATKLDGETKIMESYMTIDLESANESGLHIKVRNPFKLRVENFKIFTAKISAFFKRLARKIMDIIKKGSQAFHPIFGPFYESTSKTSLQSDKDLMLIMSLVRSENHRVLTVLAERINLLSNEIVQVRVNNEATLERLRTEIMEFKELSNRLASNNEVLTREIKSFGEVHEKFQKMESTKTVPMFLPPPPPPPPPPPTQPSITPNSSEKRVIRTPTRKSSGPTSGSRPSITVEDLLKVTLKKAPQHQKDMAVTKVVPNGTSPVRKRKENRRHTIADPRGPVISLDMLRSVKLKSVRRKSTDNGSKSPRRAHSLKTHRSPSKTFSPLVSGAQLSPLSKILSEQIDGNPRRASKRRLTSPSCNVNDFTRESTGISEEPRHKIARSIIA